MSLELLGEVFNAGLVCLMTPISAIAQVSICGFDLLVLGVMGELAYQVVRYIVEVGS